MNNFVIKLLKRNQTEVSEMKESFCKMKEIMESLNNRHSEAKERISKLEDKSTKKCRHD